MGVLYDTTPSVRGPLDPKPGLGKRGRERERDRERGREGEREVKEKIRDTARAIELLWRLAVLALLHTIKARKETT